MSANATYKESIGSKQIKKIIKILAFESKNSMILSIICHYKYLYIYT